MRIVLLLRKDSQCKTLATFMRCSSDTYQIAGLRLYEHVEIDDEDMGKFLYGESREFASSSDLQRCKVCGDSSE
jgi:hypothetical protein